MPTLLVLVDGMGKDKYMKLLYVVDVYLKEKEKHSVSFETGVGVRLDLLCHMSGTLADFGIALGKSQRQCYRSACDRSSILARLQSAEEASRAPLPEWSSPHASAY